MLAKTILKQLMTYTLVVFLVLLPSSCGTDSNNENNDNNDNVLPDTNIPNGTPQTGILSFKTATGEFAIQRITYSTPSTKAAKEEKTTDDNGTFTYNSGEQVTFIIAGKSYTVTGQEKLSQQQLSLNNADTTNHLALLFLNFDDDDNTANGIQLKAEASNLDPSLASDAFQRQLYKATGKTPKRLFTPSLGINLEAPQAEADSAGQAMPFVDIFRTARPFLELSNNNGTEIEVSSEGWPTKITPSSATARTKILQGIPQKGIPDGIYTLLYEGENTIGLSGMVIDNVAPLPSNLNSKGHLLTLKLLDSANTEANSINLIVSGNTIRNIRLVMPGGTCKHNSTGNYQHFIHVNSQADCPTSTTYVSFVSRLLANRNEIIFNPAYLRLLSNFKVIRMMNFMEASPGISACRNNQGIIDNACVAAVTLWDDRAKLSDASWGGSGRTPMKNRKGVPVEVLVELANQLHADPWFTMPHYVDDLYVHKFAEYTLNHLNAALKPYIEYSNETWNSGFIGFHYMQAKGLEIAGFDTIPVEYQREGSSRNGKYFARLRYYSQRAVEIFKIWESSFGNKLVRVIGTSQGDTVLSEQLLQFQEAPNHVDALAVAPYFFGCIDNQGSCSNAPKVLSTASSVDDIFDIIDQPFPTDPSALDATLVKIERQTQIAQREGVQLIAYEGGQHLTIMGALGSLSETEKDNFRTLFQAANRDPRMKQRYQKLLTGWKSYSNKKTTLFTLYTLPQTYYRFGNWGIKEHLGKSRRESPKFDAVMDFQEEQGTCWWDNC